jgi:hypothetical protein
MESELAGETEVLGEIRPDATLFITYPTLLDVGPNRASTVGSW